MSIINKKIWPEYFEQLETGKKKFELRLGDFEINEGDTMVLEEWDPQKKFTLVAKLKRGPRVLIVLK